MRAADRPGARIELLAEDFDTEALHDICYAGCVVAGAIEDIRHHHVGEPGCWDCYGTAVEELTRLGGVLDRLQEAIRRAGTELAYVHRRALRHAQQRTAQQRTPTRPGCQPRGGGR